MRYTTTANEITDERGDALRFNLRLPAEAQGRRIPTLILLAGIKTGDRTLDHMPPQGDNALIAYAYPYDKARWQRSSTFRRALVANRMADQVPYQLDALVRWVQAQPWADPERVSVAGGSLGAIVLPMCLRHLGRTGTTVRAAVFAYGGAGRFTLGYLSLRHRSFLLALASGLGSWLFLRRLEPAIHLPHLSGDFLIISSPDDSLVPRRCSALFEALTPEPKEIVHMRGVHVSAKTPDLLAEVVETARRRMVERGVMNP